jgi:hypothetical protein
LPPEQSAIADPELLGIGASMLDHEEKFLFK